MGVLLMVYVNVLQKEILAKMGNPVPQNYKYGNVKTLLGRIAPVMIDSIAIKALMKFIDDAVNGIGEMVEDIEEPVEKGMKLLLVCTHPFVRLAAILMH